MGLDTESIRKDFPILARQVHGKRLVYLDNAATSQKPQVVIDALTDYYSNYNANVHRGVYLISQEATDAYEGAREKVRRFFGAESNASIIFTRNATEAINLVAYAWGRRNLGLGDEIVISVMEHHSNIVPWQLLAKDVGAVLRVVDVREDGTLDMDELRALVGPRTKLVSLAHMSNVLGTINPVNEIVRLAHAHGALALLDGAQAAPHLAVDVTALDCDFYALSAHKMLGPTGVGVLYGKPELLAAMDPFLGGGDMIMSVTLAESTWNDLPHKFEAGTPNVADVIAFGTAIDYLQALGMDEVRQHEVELTGYAMDVLRSVPGLCIHGPSDPASRGGVVSFALGDIHPHDVATALDVEGLAVRAGHHCAQPLMARLGVPATARASFYVYNTKEEVDILAAALGKVRDYFGDVVRSA